MSKQTVYLVMSNWDEESSVLYVYASRDMAKRKAVALERDHGVGGIGGSFYVAEYEVVPEGAPLSLAPEPGDTWSPAMEYEQARADLESAQRVLADLESMQRAEGART